MASRGLLDELTVRYAARSGAPLSFLAIRGVDAAPHVLLGGEVFDLAVLAADTIDKPIDGGKAALNCQFDLVCLGVGVL